MVWTLIAGIVLAFALGFGMGANDVSNAFGTSVGSGVLSLKMAYFLATVFETLGALLVGYNVADAMRKDVYNLEAFRDNPKELMVGQVAILGGCAAWMLIATFARLPVSTTHSITGATLGFALLTTGASGIHWGKIIQIIASWFTSPVLSGIVSSILYIIVDFSVLRRKDPFKCGLRALPFFYWFCIAFNVMAVSYQGSKLLHLASLPAWLCATISIGSATVVSIIIHFLLAPRLKIWIEKKVNDNPKIAFCNDIATKDIEMNNTSTKKPEVFAITINDSSAMKGIDSRQSNNNSATCSTCGQSLIESVKVFFKWFLPCRARKTDQKTLKIFNSIQVFTACFAGFAHGANDVSNAIAPLAALWSIYQTMDVSQHGETPLYILIYGVVAICTGLIVLGHRVIRTVGSKMSEINSASGFTIEFGAAVTALCASKLGLPISTTHSLVGSVVMVGTIRCEQGIDWSLFRNIALSWVVTVPVSGLISVGLMLILRIFL
ncbi:hypothetical protein AB6A40_008972 [Gnathostoma spinigerum]|uniref:Phosphate transporter n=1 Tax=Gnathostoma spinigerum TaxID=75299 RepID=A0ABD6EQZ5_9BILA